MKLRNNHPPPILDLSGLDDDHEILMDYDSNGNLTRVRKVRRYEGCLLWFIILIAVAIVAWYIKSPHA